MRFSITAALTFGLTRAAFADPGVSPASVNKPADPGSYVNVDKIVTTPEIPPKPDVVLLVDVTGSMGVAIDNIKKNLDKVINTVTDGQPDSQFAVVSFGDLQDPNGFKVVQGLTKDVPALHAAVASLTARGGRDAPEDWINALYQLSTGAVTYRGDSSRIIVLVSDQPSHNPSGGHSLDDTITALKAESIRVIGVNVDKLNQDGQATAVTDATGGIIIGSDADTVTSAIISGLKNLDAIVKPDVVSCDAGVTVEFDPVQTQVSSGTVVIFHETAKVADDAAQRATLHCSVRFLLNGTPGGDAFIQSFNVTVNQLGCDTCNPHPGKNLCHPTTSCSPTPYGTMCLTRPGYKADGAKDGDRKVQWRLKWPVPGHEHRVAVKPGTSADTLCDPKNKGSNVCKEIAVGDCPTPVTPVLGSVRHETDQIVIGEGEL